MDGALSEYPIVSCNKDTYSVIESPALPLQRGQFRSALCGTLHIAGSFAALCGTLHIAEQSVGFIGAERRAIDRLALGWQVTTLLIALLLRC
jgi:hypothetical protein